MMKSNMFKIPPDAESTSKLFLIHGGRKGDKYIRIYVVCIASVSLLELRPSRNDHVNILDYTWRIQNSNMQGWHVDTGAGFLKFDPRIHTCSAIQRGRKRYPKTPGTIKCAQIVLGDKLNFTDISVYGVKKYRRRRWYKVDLRIVYHEVAKIEDDFYYTMSARYTWLPYCEKRLEFKTAVVAFMKHGTESFHALISPLDSYTWAAAMISFTLVASLLTTIALQDGEASKNPIAYFIQSWQWIMSSLSGQYHGTSEILRLSTHFALFVAVFVWSFYLLGTVFYQGSIFSALISFTPPDLPLTLKSLAFSNVQIITSSGTYGSQHKIGSLLKEVILNNLIKNNVSSIELSIATKLRTRARFIAAESEFLIGSAISRERNITFEKRVTKRAIDTFGIINVKHQLEEMLAGLRVRRDPYIVRHTEPSILYLNLPRFVSRGFITAIVSQGLVS